MHIDALPAEIVTSILERVAGAHERSGIRFSYGLCQAPAAARSKSTLSRYVRGPVPPDSQRWDAVASLRCVCRSWHDWSLAYALRDLYVRKWKGSDRWAELPARRQQYAVYELIGAPSGAAVRRDPASSLDETQKLLRRYPAVAAKVRRLWFDGFYTADYDQRIFSTLLSCHHLVAATVPWTALRHVGPDAWAALLTRHHPDFPDLGPTSTAPAGQCGEGISPAAGHGLTSLELMAIELTDSQKRLAASQLDLRPLRDGRVHFGTLRRLKLFGNTCHLPITDADLIAIAATATRLEEFHITALSTVSVQGVIAIVKSSHATLRVLEHSPRGDVGFSHPHPGTLPTSEHLCDLLASCPQLRDLSISMPSVCAHLFANRAVKWAGECQVRAARLCNWPATLSDSGGPGCGGPGGGGPGYGGAGGGGPDNTEPGSTDPAPDTASRRTGASLALARLLAAARDLSAAVRPRALVTELFFAACVFDPGCGRVHGAFGLAGVRSRGAWPPSCRPSPKGPYGSTGLYEKEDEQIWQSVDEDEYLHALRTGWVSLDDTYFDSDGDGDGDGDGNGNGNGNGDGVVNVDLLP